uniref:Uncharacterized protein n=1 Tax=Anguilla anguilla TaxID=7936 RepID=A0A0E9UCK3_ANGAN
MLTVSYKSVEPSSQLTSSLLETLCTEP